LTNQTGDPESMPWHIDTIRDAAGECDIRYGHVPKSLLPVRKFVAFANGRTEWIEKYDYLPRDLALPEEFGFVTWDHRGQGASGGARAYVDSYDVYGSDAARVTGHVCADKPFALMAHSMGGLIALHAVLKGQIKPKALVLCSPLFGMPNVPVPRLLAKPSSRLLTHLKLGTLGSGAGNHTKRPFAFNNLTHDVARYRRMQHSPHPVGSATFGWVNQTFAAIDAVFSPANLRELTVPVLVIGGSSESVVDGDGFQRWTQLAAEHAKADIELVLVQGARHELLSEIPKYYEKTLAAARRWITKHVV